MMDPGSSSVDTDALSAEACWDAVLSRDAAFDGRFYYSVASTGVYCRPSCPARRPRRVHVRFHATPHAAEAAGFRPCKRCKPDGPALAGNHRNAVAKVCRIIEAAEVPPALAALAESIGMSPYHLHRVFKRETGVTPKAYATAHRNKRTRQALARSANVTQAVYDAGFSSSSRFYATSTEVLGMTPRTFRAGGTNTAMQYAIDRCSLGAILVAATDKGICAILLGDSPKYLLDDLHRQFPRAQLTKADDDFAQMTANVIALVDTPGTPHDLPLDVRGTAFQQRVWEALRRIPAGQTATYAEIAAAVGAPKSARAVAAACAANRLAVAIPCHRVVRSDGGISGYHWGVKRKRALLAKESKR